MFLISIRFLAAFGDETKVVELSAPNGGGGGGYQLLVDKLYWGTVSKMIGGWQVLFQHPKDEFSGGDLQVLIDMVSNQTDN